jgi:hypothetical protein
MSDEQLREPDQIRQDCARKLRSVETSGVFSAVLACLVGEDWTTPRLEEMRLTPDRCLIGRPSGDVRFSSFIGAETDLIKNIHGIAEVAGLDGDEVGYLVGQVAKLKRME